MRSRIIRKLLLNGSLLIVMVAAFAGYSFSQILNIESNRIVSDSTGWFGDVAADFSFQQNVNTIYAFNTKVHIENKAKNNKDLWLFLGNAGLLKVNESDFTRNALAMVLYNRKLGNLVRLETYSIILTNQVNNILVRWSIGAGPRFKLLDRPVLKIYAGVPYTFEYEKSALDDVADRRENRVSSYLTFTFRPVSNVKFVGTLYYQPLLNDFSNYRILQVDQLKVDLTRKFAFTIDFSYLYDADPQPDVPKRILALSTGVKYKFR